MMLNHEQRSLLHDLLHRRRTGVLGVLVKGEPVTGLLPFALTPNGVSILVFASTLARHTRGLEDGAPFSFLIHAPDLPEIDAFQVPRLSLAGKAYRISRDAPAFDAAWQVYQDKLPQAEILFGLKDFNLFALQIEAARFVTGFAAAFTLGPEDLAEINQGMV